MCGGLFALRLPHDAGSSRSMRVGIFSRGSTSAERLQNLQPPNPGALINPGHRLFTVLVPWLYTATHNVLRKPLAEAPTRTHLFRLGFQRAPMHTIVVHRWGVRSGQASRAGGPSIHSLLARALQHRTAITSRPKWRGCLIIISIVVIAALQHLRVAEALRVALLPRAATRDLHVGVGGCSGSGMEASLDAWLALDDLELCRAQLACRDAQARAQLGTVPRAPGVCIARSVTWRDA